MLSVQSIFACCLSIHGIVSSIFYLSIDPYSAVMSPYMCKFFNTPRTISFIMISVVLIITSFERAYATYKFKIYNGSSKNRYLIMILVGNFLSGSCFHILSMQGLKSDQSMTIWVGSIFSSQTISIIGGVASIFISTLCSIVVSVNKIWNHRKLKNYQWFNRGQFDLKSRIQLSQNIDTNQSIFWMTLVFLLTFVVVVSISLYPVLIFKSYDLVDSINTIFYSVVGQQMYCLLYIFAYVFGSDKLRSKILARRFNWKNFMKIRKATTEHQVVPMAKIKSIATKKYIVDLKNVWNS